jgi:hypothetical protein
MSFSRKSLLALSFWAAASLAGAAFAQTPQPAAPDKMAPAPKASAMTKAAPATLLDINSASEAELQALPGIGDKRAADIIKNRPSDAEEDHSRRRLRQDQESDHRQAEIGQRVLLEPRAPVARP